MRRIAGQGVAALCSVCCFAVLSAAPASAQPADLGACCLPGGLGCDQTTEQLCEQFGGSFEGVGVACFQAACGTILRDCCLEDGTCISENASRCRNIEHGGWIPSGCPVDPANCTEGVDCCDDIGACCNQGSCSELSLSECLAEPGLPQYLPGLSCADAGCDGYFGGACCFGATCQETFQANCLGLGGDWKGSDIFCEDLDENCNVLSGACCDYYGDCTEGTPSDCFRMEADYQGDGTICESDTCPQLGACCEEIDPGVYECYEEFAENCLSFSGLFFGEGTFCDDPQVDCENPPSDGACCFGPDDCSQLTPEECGNQGGSFEGLGLPCEQAVCTDVTGACCFGAEICSEITPEACDSQFGLFQGVGVTCEQAACSDTIIGRCCIPFGGCENSSLNDCFQVLGGGSWTPTLDCSSPCAPFGACCDGAGGCIPRTESTCNFFGNTYLGDDITCDDNPCSDPTCPFTCGDISGDSAVDLLDFAKFVPCYDVPISTQDCSCSDMNGDQSVDLNDFLILVVLFDGSSTNTPPDCQGAPVR